MNDTQKTIAASVVVVGAVTAIALKVRSYHKDLYGRFPELDRKIVRKAFRRMMTLAMTGQISDSEMANDATMDELFLQQVRYITEGK